MRAAARIVFGLNFIYQLLVAIVCIFLPATALELYGAPADATGIPFLLGSMRMIGAALSIGVACSLLIARDPDSHPVLLPLMAVLAGATLLAEGIMLGTGEANVGQLALDIVFQIAIIGVAFAYRPAAQLAPARV